MNEVSVLIVEDERIVAMDLKDRLEDLGYLVTGMAVSGEKAIEKAKETHPNIVLMDIHLKGEMDGIEAAGLIHNLLSIPIIYVTAYADDKTLDRAKDTEPFGYIVKPFQERELHAAISMALHKHKKEMESKEYQEQLERLVEERTRELEVAKLEIAKYEELASQGRIVGDIDHKESEVL